jgi:hypothetical protein
MPSQVHHSRNTEQKQWDETLVLSLNGMGRLLRSYLPVLSSLEGFDLRWDSFLAFFESSVVDGNREVAVAAIGSLTAILQVSPSSTRANVAAADNGQGQWSSVTSRLCGDGRERLNTFPLYNSSTP